MTDPLPRSHSPNLQSSLSRPTTPLRPSSRSSFRNSTTSNNQYLTSNTNHFPLDTLEPQFAELADSMADLEANFQHLQLMHESLGRFAENFASMLYGLEMCAFVVDFGEAPMGESIRRWQKMQRANQGLGNTSTLIPISRAGGGADETMIGDTTGMSSASMKATPRRKSIVPQTPSTGTDTGNMSTVGKGRSGIPASTSRGGMRGGTRGARGSGLPRGRGVGTGSGRGGLR